MNDNPFEDRDHAMIVRSEIWNAVRKYVAEKFPTKKVETIVLPGLERKDSRPGYVLFKK